MSSEQWCTALPPFLSSSRSSCHLLTDVVFHACGGGAGWAGSDDIGQIALGLDRALLANGMDRVLSDCFEQLFAPAAIFRQGTHHSRVLPAILSMLTQDGAAAAKSKTRTQRAFVPHLPRLLEFCLGGSLGFIATGVQIVHEVVSSREAFQTLLPQQAKVTAVNLVALLLQLLKLRKLSKDEEDSRTLISKVRADCMHCILTRSPLHLRSF